jgi:TolA-binding protein
MKIKLILAGAILSALITSCGTGNKEKETKSRNDSLRAGALRNPKILKEQFSTSIKEAEEKMKGAKSSDYNAEIARGLIKSYLDYANAFPEDTMAPDYFYRAGEIAASGGSYDQAVFLFQTVSEKYPNYKYVVEALYEEAMIYDSKLPGQDPKAKLIYEDIIKRYPTHKLAADAKIAISNLGKTDEELVKEFEKKNHMK